MVRCILVNGKIIKFMEKGCILGLMEENSKENGKIIICMEKENILGQTEDHMMEIMIKIKKMDMDSIFGFNIIKVRQTEENILDTGVMVNNTDKELISIKMDWKEKASGKMELDYNGLTTMINKNNNLLNDLF